MTVVTGQESDGQCCDREEEAGEGAAIVEPDAADDRGDGQHAGRLVLGHTVENEPGHDGEETRVAASKFDATAKSTAESRTNAYRGVGCLVRAGINRPAMKPSMESEGHCRSRSRRDQDRLLSILAMQATEAT